MKALGALELAAAEDGSYYTVCGCGGSLDEWVEGYEKIMKEREVGTPSEWFSTTGASVNLYAMQKFGGSLHPGDMFQDDLVILMFPLKDLNVGVLAVMKIQMQDRWFDDIIGNMRPGR